MPIKHLVPAIIILTALASCSGTSTSVNCKQYKNGKFRFTANHDGKKYDYVIERNNDIQTEVCDELNWSATLKVSWKDDCTYQLAYMNGKDDLPPEMLETKRKNVLQTTILSGTDNYYIFETTSDLFGKAMKDTMWLMK